MQSSVGGCSPRYFLAVAGNPVQGSSLAGEGSPQASCPSPSKRRLSSSPACDEGGGRGGGEGPGGGGDGGAGEKAGGDHQGLPLAAQGA